MLIFVMQIMMEFMRWCCTIDRSPIEGRGKAVVRLDNHPDHDDDDDHDHDDDDDRDDVDDYAEIIMMMTLIINDAEGREGAG